MITCSFRARGLKPPSIAQGHVFLKLVCYDKIKFPFSDIVKNQPFDLMLILCQFLCDKAYVPLAGVIFISGPTGRRDLSASREDFNFMKAEA